MNNQTSARVLSVCCWTALALFSCQAIHDDDAVGRATFELQSVPADVNCVRITAVADTHTTTRDFTVAPGASESLQVTGLPLGAVKFYGEAYQASCSSLGANPTAQWRSDAVQVTVSEDMPAPVNLVLRRSSTGTGVVNVQFEDPGLPPESLPTCSAGTTEKQTCGQCGTQDRVCRDDGFWSTWGPCNNEGECLPTATESCGMGGTRTCTAQCIWSECAAQVCPGEKQCEPGQVGNCTGSGLRRCDASCTWGECDCSTGTTACGDGCFDLNINTMHCGACNNTCSAGQICKAGKCS